MTIDELVAKAAQLPPMEQEELVRRLLALCSQPHPRSVLPPGTPGSISLANWERVRTVPAVADEMERVIAEECEKIDPND
jgi:hypothetical protein